MRIAVANQKGGVGKTTTAVNLATAFAAAGRRALLVDLDPQGNASTGLGVARQARAITSYDLLLGSVTLAEATLPTPVPALGVVPATADLAGAEIELVEADDRAGRLARALDGEDALVVIDTPPSLGLLTLNALVAANHVLVPLQCEFFALEGLTQIMKTIEGVRARANPDLQLLGVVLTMHDRRNRLSEQVEADVRGALGDRVLKTVIPRNVRLSEAPSHGLPALLYDLRCPGSEAYLALAREILARVPAAPALQAA